MSNLNPDYVTRNGSNLFIPTLSSPFVISNFITAMYQGSEEGYTDFSLVDAYLDAVSHTAECEEGVILGLEWCLNEVMDNVLQYYKINHGYVMGQIHQTSQRIAICIYNYGQGIFKSLVTKPRSQGFSKPWDLSMLLLASIGVHGKLPQVIGGTLF